MLTLLLKRAIAPLQFGIFLLFTHSPAVADQGFSPSFWKHWSDGKAEITSYDSLQTRYGESRKGVTVAIFVTEPFSNSDRVKADPGVHPESDVQTVLKLNFVEDFPTGIYDYNLMSSVFVSTANKNGFQDGTPMKVSFSSQEWCGHTYSQLLPKEQHLEHSLHSYFDGEADKKESIPVSNEWFLEDTLLFWARGLARPFMQAGESRSVNSLARLKESRLEHTALTFQSAQLSIASAESSIEVPAGTFEVREHSFRRADGRWIKLHVEAAFPHKIIKWESSTGDVGELVKSARIAYWNENSSAGLRQLETLGLKPRERRMP